MEKLNLLYPSLTKKSKSKSKSNSNSKLIVDPPPSKMSYCKNTKDGTTPHSTNNDYFSLSVSYDDNVLKEEFENLRKIKVSICDLENPDRFYKIPFFMLGRACSNNFFHRIRLSVPTQNKKETPLEWTEKHKKSYNEIQRIKHPATQFPPIVATHVCSVLMGLSKKKQFVVFDPYAGWGDRLLGISAVDGAKYIGVDLNPKLQIQANIILIINIIHMKLVVERMLSKGCN